MKIFLKRGAGAAGFVFLMAIGFQVTAEEGVADDAKGYEDSWMCSAMGHPIQICEPQYFAKCGDDDGGSPPDCST